MAYLNSGSRPMHSIHQGGAGVKKKWSMKYYFRLGLVLFLFFALLLKYHRSNTEQILRGNQSTASVGLCKMSVPSGSTYRGPQYSLEGTTIGAPECILDSKFVKVSRHTLQFTKDEPVIDDWIWIDYHDRVNVLVEAPGEKYKNVEVAPLTAASENGTEAKLERKWMIFKQSKYALEGRESLAIIGGIIEPDDKSAESAAHRETKEEMNVQCKFMVPLGRYRTDVNRGMGWVNSFVAMDCTPMSVSENKTGEKSEVPKNEEVGAADQEKQEIIIMTTSQVKEAVQEGRFLEVQWSNTVALAMLHSLLVTGQQTSAPETI